MAISKGLAERTVVAQVDGELWDLDRPLEKSCKLELLDFEHEKGEVTMQYLGWCA
jgi:threonyl-tRNA synthetase